MSEKHYVGEIGTEVIVDCGTDISAASPTSLKVKKPDGTIATWTATVYNTNYLRHLVAEGDFDQEGVYRIQAYLTLGTWVGLGETDEFKIYAAYD